MPGKGLAITPIRWPEEYSASFFERLFRETIALADVRNATEGPGITITGAPDQPATIAASTDIDNLLAASLLTVTGSSLDNARVLIGEPGVLEVVDNGVGTTATVRIDSIPYTKLTDIPGVSLLGTPLPGAGSPEGITATADDTVMRRVSGVLSFGALTVDTAPDSLWTYAKVQDAAAVSVLGRSANTGGVLADIEAAANDQVLRRDSDSISFGGVPDGAIAESGVTQHEAALDIGFDQLTGTPEIPGGLSEYADDAAADSGGIAIDGLYRTGSVVKIRVA